MELHRLDWEVFVTNRHDDAVVGLGGHFEAGWEGLSIGEEGMIPAHLKSLRKSFKYAFAGMRHPGSLAVHGIVQHSQSAAERLHHTLKAQTHSEYRNTLAHGLFHDLADAEIGRAARTGRD